MSEEFAPNWEQNQGLTWSGKWHVISAVIPEKGWSPEHLRFVCGAYGYTRDQIPRDHGVLQEIRTGMRQAPLCKKCERAARPS